MAVMNTPVLATLMDWEAADIVDAISRYRQKRGLMVTCVLKDASGSEKASYLLL